MHESGLWALSGKWSYLPLKSFTTLGAFALLERLVYKGRFLGPTFRESDVAGVVLGLGMGL